MSALDKTYKQDKKVYVVLLAVYVFLAIILNGIWQDIVTAILFLYVLFLMYLYDKMCVEQDNRYIALSDIQYKTVEELQATKAELEQYRNHQESA